VANGFFPVIRLAQLQHISAHGGYARLLTLEADEARELVGQGDALHDKWVGSEPLNTQYAKEEAFAHTRYNKDLSEAYKHHYAGGNRMKMPFYALWVSLRKTVPQWNANQWFGRFLSFFPFRS
jgi:hypothetical protein